MSKQTPQWHLISMLPTIATHIDGMLKAAQEQYQSLLLVKAKPHVLDDYTVNRVKKVFTEQQNDLWLFEEQLARWKSGSLTGEQRTEVERLVGVRDGCRPQRGSDQKDTNVKRSVVGDHFTLQ